MIDNTGISQSLNSKIVTRSPEETERFGQTFAEQLKPGDVVTFFGTLGSGKTTMIRGICMGFGIERGVKSPSFVYMRVYHAKITIYHFDFYRLHAKADLVNVDLNEYFYGEGIVLVEWADRVEKLLPPLRYDVRMTMVSKNEREIVVSYRADRGQTPHSGRIYSGV
jgi:tRNA threonylcarbamoyladenosine biosynthesis protein TsaE